jgi:hypothetical protein
MADGVDVGTVSPEKTLDLVAEIGVEGTLASIQSKTAKMRFDPDSGGLKEDAPTPPEEAAPAGEEGADAAAAGDDKTAEELAAEAAATKEKEDKKPKEYATKEDAEKAALAATQKMTEATTQAARDKEAREATERENAELKAKLEETLAKAPEKPAEEEAPVKPEEHQKRVRAATKAALSTIRGLDRTADDYDEQVEEAWAIALLEAGTGTLSQAEIDKMVNGSLKAAKDAQAAAEAEKEKATASDRAWQAAIDQGKKAGLTLDDTRSADYRLFDSIERDLTANGLPEDLKGKPLKDVVDYIVKEVRKLTGAVVQTTDAERERARKAQINNTVLTKGLTAVKSKADEPETYTLAELQRQDLERRKARQRGA